MATWTFGIPDFQVAFLLTNLHIMNSALITFIKNPIKGTVKTRLAAEVGEERALAIYLELMRHTRKVSLQIDAVRYLYYAKYINDNDSWPNEYFQKYVQPEGDLGHRMETAFQTVLQRHDKAIIIGSDCASLSADIIEEAFRVLDHKDVVIGPALDGGYYLLGMKKVHPKLFRNMTWSTEDVCQITLQRVVEQGLQYGEVAALSDIDYAADWEKYGWDLEV